jgi:hypothetical protein
VLAGDLAPGPPGKLLVMGVVARNAGCTETGHEKPRTRYLGVGNPLSVLCGGLRSPMRVLDIHTLVNYTSQHCETSRASSSH